MSRPYNTPPAPTFAQTGLVPGPCEVRTCPTVPADPLATIASANVVVALKVTKSLKVVIPENVDAPDIAKEAPLKLVIPVVNKSSILSIRTSIC